MIFAVWEPGHSEERALAAAAVATFRQNLFVFFAADKKKERPLRICPQPTGRGASGLVAHGTEGSQGQENQIMQNFVGT